jgi:hypothetical protein
MQELKHRQQIRRTDDTYRPEITVHTFEGGVREDMEARGHSYCMLETDEDKIFANNVRINSDGDYYGEVSDLERAIELLYYRCDVLGHSKDQYTILSPSCICADYPGKEEDMRKEQEAYYASPIVENGERVVIEGKELICSYGDRRCSIPVTFMDPDKYAEREEKMKAYREAKANK